MDARRRAREAAEAAIDVLRSEGYYDYAIQAGVSDADPPQATVNITVGPRSTLAPAALVWDGAPPTPPLSPPRARPWPGPQALPARRRVLAAEGRALTRLPGVAMPTQPIHPRQVVIDHATHLVEPTFRLAAGPLVRLDGVKV